MRRILVAAALAVLAVPAAQAQQPAPAGRPPASVQTAPLRGLDTGPARRPDAAIEADRRRSEDQLKRREERARRMMRGICTGC